MSEFKSMLRYLRKREGWSQDDLAKRLKISKSTVSMYELGQRQPDFEMLEKIADLFNVDMDFLLGREQEEYYLNPETRRLAQELYENPERRILFDATRDLTPESIKAVLAIIDNLEKK